MNRIRQLARCLWKLSRCSKSFSLSLHRVLGGAAVGLVAVALQWCPGRARTCTCTCRKCAPCPVGRRGPWSGPGDSNSCEWDGSPVPGHSAKADWSAFRPIWITVIDAGSRSARSLAQGGLVARPSKVTVPETFGRGASCVNPSGAGPFWPIAAFFVGHYATAWLPPQSPQETHCVPQ